MSIKENHERLAEAHILAARHGKGYLSIDATGTLNALDPEKVVLLSRDVFLMTNNAAALLQAMGFRWEGEDWIAPSESDWIPIGEVRLGEYDDSGSHPDAHVVCLHEQAGWENFSEGTKLYLSPTGKNNAEEAWKLPASRR